MGDSDMASYGFSSAIGSLFGGLLQHQNYRPGMPIYLEDPLGNQGYSGFGAYQFGVNSLGGYFSGLSQICNSYSERYRQALERLKEEIRRKDCVATWFESW